MNLSELSASARRIYQYWLGATHDNVDLSTALAFAAFHDNEEYNRLKLENKLVGRTYRPSKFRRITNKARKLQ